MFPSPLAERSIISMVSDLFVYCQTIVRDILLIFSYLCSVDTANYISSLLNVGVIAVRRLTGSVNVIQVEPRSSEKSSADNDRKLDLTGRPFSVGLNLKSTKRKWMAPGYTKWTPSGWRYSQKTIDLLKEYYSKWPEVFAHIAMNRHDDILLDGELFPANTYVYFDEN